jgi:hypothetical protein
MEILSSASAKPRPGELLKIWANHAAQKSERSITMSDDNNRVLNRRGARDLDYSEIDLVGGSLRTFTFCSFSPQFGADGDVKIGEC